MIVGFSGFEVFSQKQQRKKDEILLVLKETTTE